MATVTCPVETSAPPSTLNPPTIHYDVYKQLSREEQKAYRNGIFEDLDMEVSDARFYSYDAAVTLEELLECEVSEPGAGPHFNFGDDGEFVRRKTDDECFTAEISLLEKDEGYLDIVYDVRGNPFRNAAARLNAYAAKLTAAAQAMEARAVEVDAEIAEKQEGGGQ
jgi:hypothetical protein